MNKELISEALFKEVLLTIKSLKDELTELKQMYASSKPFVYDNEGVRALLGVNDKLLRKYRNEGWLSFTKIGDKYWYLESDVKRLLENKEFRYSSFAS